MTAKKFASVMIAIGTRHCDAVDALQGARILATHAPRLPMANCSMAEQCRCRFQKYSDRREDEQGRRFKYGGEHSAWYAGAQRRKSGGRRPSD